MEQNFRKIALVVHLDTVAETLGFTEKFSDPSYFSVMDRFLEIAENRKFKLSIYPIGRELEDPRKIPFQIY